MPDRPSAGGLHSAYLETRDALYHLISCLEGLVPTITSRRERRELFELLGRVERQILDLMIAEELGLPQGDADEPGDE